MRKVIPPIKPKTPSIKITPEIAAEIKRLSMLGLYQHDIAAKIGCNQGRISEVLTGKTYPQDPESSPGLFE